MARLRYNGLATGASGSTVGLSLGASLTSGATSLTFNAALSYNNGTAVPTIVSPDYIPLEILDANGLLSEVVYLTAYTAAATTGTITRGREGTTGVAHSSGDKIIHGPTAGDVGVRFASLVCNSGTVTTSATSIAVLTNSGGAGTIQVTVSANVGDLLEMSINAQSSQGSPTGNLDLNVATFVSGAEVNRVGGTGTTGSICSWSVRQTAFWPVDGHAFYVVQSGDVSSGTVNLRLMGVVAPGGSGTLGLFSTAAAPLIFAVKNLGQAGS